MQSFNIIKQTDIIDKSFRVAQISDQFDLDAEEIVENFQGEIDIPNEWNIGIIVGKSGTGKTTILNELYKDTICKFRYKKNCVIDDFNDKLSSSDIFNMLSSVGFSSPPSWLKPYSVLSNGEKMRVDLARALLENKNIISFDEYTSVIDREVAKVGSLAVNKAVRKHNKKFIAVTCHFDIIEWLDPDWIFSTDTMENLPRGSLHQRPEIKLEARRKKGYWKYFRKYHYLNHDLNKSSHEYVLFYNDKPIGFCAIINFPHQKHSPMWKVHRLVVLPDYQGLGIGIRFLNLIAELYYPKYFGITTSLNSFAKSIKKNKNWYLIRAGKTGNNSNQKELNKSLSSNRNTYSFRFKK